MSWNNKKKEKQKNKKLFSAKEKENEHTQKRRQKLFDETTDVKAKEKNKWSDNARKKN